MQATETLRGTVTRVFFANIERGWMAGKLRTEEGVEHGFAGNVTAGPGDKIEISGPWVDHPRFGRQLEVKTGVARMDESPAALEHLLATHADFKGIGPARAKKLVDAALFLSHDGEITSALDQHPEEIAARSRIPLVIVEQAREAWLAKRDYFGAIAALIDQGWSASQAAAIIKVFGENAAHVAGRDPYTLIGKVPRFGFRTVDAIALKNGTPTDDPDRMKAGVAFCLDRIGNEGHTWTTRRDLIYQAGQELRPDTLAGEAAILAALEAMIRDGFVHLDRSPDGVEVLANARIFQTELAVFEILLAGLQEPAERPLLFDGERAQAAILPLNDGQRAAVEGLGAFRFGVMTGRAGSGKTFTTQALCAIAMENKLRFALCAPTGKASRKLARSSGFRARTIHKLLDPCFDEETGGFRFTRHAGNPLDADLVIVDEASMIDVRLMHSLLVALKPGARLLLVGDHHQIPSVGAGAILRDLLSSTLPLARSIHALEEVVRQAGELERNTSAILDGVVHGRPSPMWAIESTARGHEEGAAGCCAMLVEAIVTTDEPEPFDRNLDLAWDIQVLAPMKKGPLGVFNLNAHLQAMRQRQLGNLIPERPEKDRPPKPLIGDRVIWTKNDYELDLMNGTQALVHAVHKNGSMDLLIEKEPSEEEHRIVTISAGQRAHVDVAWAITIHKAQGSEWPCVILCISSSHHVMRDRNLLYTGASRAAESLTILGDMAGIKGFARHQRSKNRQTFGGFLVAGWRPTI